MITVQNQKDNQINKPVIGVTTFHSDAPADGFRYLSTSEVYARAISQAGGIPVLLPIELADDDIAQLRKMLDGVLLIGGGDIDPSLYGGAMHSTVYNVDPDRDHVEIQLVRRAIDSDWPFLGICRGMQVINVAMGGTLYTDVLDQHPGAVKHDYTPGYPRDKIVHEVNVIPGTKIHNILGESVVKVNSLHHQAVLDVASGFVPAGYATDGVLEAMELPGHSFGLAVQWHPEWITKQAPMQRLFKTFMMAALNGGSAN